MARPKSDKSKNQIVQKSSVLFNKKGIAGTSLADIMEATGLAKGSLYGNFKSKDEIAEAAFDYAVNAVWNQLRKRTFQIENSVDKLKAVVYFYKEHILSYPIEGGCPILNTAIEADDSFPVLRKKVVSTLDYWQSRIIATIKEGVKNGEIQPDCHPEAFATLFIATLEGGIFLSRTYQSIEPFNVVSKQLLKMIEDLQLKKQSNV